ncbi:YicC family protein [bacterium]|nr:YicC family protein [bacterium]
MIQSMTGFAERKFDSEGLSAQISIKSLNSRFLDMHFRGTPLGEVEENLRALCQKKFQRGRIEVYVELTFQDQQKWDLYFNRELLKKILFSLEELSSEMGRQIHFSVDKLFTIPQVMEIRRKSFTPEEIDFLEKSFEENLERLSRARQREGEEIRKKLKEHISMLKKKMDHVQELSSQQPDLIKKKLEERLNKLKTEVSEERLAEEVAVLAQKFDLTEEIARLSGHLEHFQELLSPDKKAAVGKKLDFLSQEMSREIHTLSSKSQDLELTKKGLDIKSEIESIRQQVQNVE